MGRLALTFFLGVLLFMPPASALGQDAEILTLWPLIDYRRTEDSDFVSFHLLGPLFSYQRTPEETRYGLRPLYHHVRNAEGKYRYSEFLYPLASRKAEPKRTFFQGLHLLNYDFGRMGDPQEDEFLLFPFVFYRKTDQEGEGYLAIFPLGGKITNRFGRDEIQFALFPLYSRTQKKGTTVTNVLWPIGARIEGENESGWKFWPLAGASQKEGVYRKRFYLWPFYFDYRLAQDTEAPLHQRMFFPFFFGEDSPQRVSRTYLWPFFSHIQDRAKGYEEWNLPWPIFRVAEGGDKEIQRFLPFYADERGEGYRKRWFLWPLYKIEETETEFYQRRRDRVLFFLYSDLKEQTYGEDGKNKRRTAFWPLFSYEENDGVSHFYTLSLLEPFFPESGGIERNWSPLWRLYQRKWDRHGNEMSSLLWNLYWKERRGDDLALEIFPLLSFRRDVERGVDWSLLKGLLRYRSGPEGRRVNLFYLPWGLPLGKG